nr:LysR family transcriptional regulator [Devosia crocina]
MSQHIKRLEEQAGQPLLSRTTQRSALRKTLPGAMRQRLMLHCRRTWAAPHLSPSEFPHRGADEARRHQSFAEPSAKRWGEALGPSHAIPIAGRPKCRANCTLRLQPASWCWPFPPLPHRLRRR